MNSEWALSKGADVIDKKDFMDEWLRRCAGRSNQKLICNFVDFSGGRYIVNYATPISGMSLGLCMVEGCLMGYRLAQSLI